MATFTIDSDNNITAHAGPPAGADESQSFSNPRELAKLTRDWPLSRLVETWNSFANATSSDDLKPVKKFRDRKAAVGRIWKALVRFFPDVAPQAADGAPLEGKARNMPAKPKRRHTAAPGVKRGAHAGREGSKKAEVVEMLRCAKGATLAAIMEKTGWQAHTVRGFVSGTLVKKLGLKVESFRTAENERAYRITS